MRKLTTESFIKKSIDIHGDKYDYSKVNYTGSRNKVTIICENHGEFQQIPSNHLQGKGCKLCQYDNLSNKFSSNSKEFIDKATKIHGNKYDYSKVNYSKWNEEVTIICKLHGEFNQRCNVHLNGSGCPKCVSTSLEQVKEKIYHKFGDKFKYDFSNYENLSSTITITCPNHGDFKSKISNHLNSEYGCKKCYYDSISLDTKEFIRRAKIIHRNEYHYDSVEYLNNQTPVDIFCEKHGLFSQKPMHHLSGSGCPACGIYKKSKISFSDFIGRANEIFSNKYNYEIKDEWNGISGKIIVICPKHGKSLQRCDSHLRGEGCPKCGSDKLSKSLTKSDEDYESETELVVEKIKNVHGETYSYENFVYRGSDNKSLITCKKHGDFEQRVSHHLSGNGCPKCNSSKGESIINKFLTENNIKYESEMRVGKFRFDFYLPEYNLIIEYDGVQHFEPVDHFGGEEYYEKIRKNDKIKDNYCLNNNIELLRIPYWEYDKIEYILYEKIIEK